MDLCSSFPGFSEFTCPSEEIVVDDNLFGEHPWLKLMIKPLFVYGSLPRPPDLHYTLVSTCLRTLLSQFLDFGARNVVADVVFLSYLASRYAHREGELRLDSFKQILEYEINIGWLELLLEHPVFMFRTYVQLVSQECNMVCLILIYDLCKLTRLVFFVESSTLCCGVVHELCLNSEDSFQHQNLSRQGENLNLAIDIIGGHINYDSCAIIRGQISLKKLLPDIIEVYNIFDQNDSQRQFGTTVVPVACQVGYVGHHPGVVNAAVYSNAAAGSLNIVVPAAFQVRTVGHHPSVVNVAVSSNSDSSLNTGIYDKDDCVFAGKRFCFKQKMFGWLKYSQQHIVHCFRTKTSHGALYATHDLLLKQSLPLVFICSQSRDYGFTKHLLLDLPGRFGTSIEILFGSLPRPPETHCNFSSNSLEFMWHSSSPR